MVCFKISYNLLDIMFLFLNIDGDYLQKHSISKQTCINLLVIRQLLVFSFNILFIFHMMNEFILSRFPPENMQNPLFSDGLKCLI